MEIMDTKYFLLFVILVVLKLTSCEQTSGTDCDECDQSSCQPPTSCLAGMVKDSCDCCYLCGQREGQLCTHPYLRNSREYGKCGKDLECRIRTDLDPDDELEATCFCKQTYPICGSDGVTYDNVCQLREERYRRRDGLRAVSREPCRAAPKIISAPQNQHNKTGTYVALLCEASGWPSPEMKWRVLKSGSEPTDLPGSDSRIVVHSRSSSTYGDITSWLLITHLLEEDDATYKCVAENDLGSDSASAHVYVTDS